MNTKELNKIYKKQMKTKADKVTIWYYSPDRCA